jgi:hypothetical protein
MVKGVVPFVGAATGVACEKRNIFWRACRYLAALLAGFVMEGRTGRGRCRDLRRREEEARAVAELSPPLSQHLPAAAEGLPRQCFMLKSAAFRGGGRKAVASWHRSLRLRRCAAQRCCAHGERRASCQRVNKRRVVSLVNAGV